MTKSIYNLKSTALEGAYAITKFDENLDLESTYVTTLGECTCPQAHRSTCRHRKMLPMFLALTRQDTEYFLDFDTKTWHRPLALEYEVEYHDLLVGRLMRQAEHEHAKNEPTPLAVPASSPLHGTATTEGQPASTSGEDAVPRSSSPSVASLTRRRLG